MLLIFTLLVEPEQPPTFVGLDWGRGGALTLRPPTFRPPLHLDPLEMSTVTLFPCDTLTYCYVLTHSQ